MDDAPQDRDASSEQPLLVDSIRIRLGIQLCRRLSMNQRDVRR